MELEGLEVGSHFDVVSRMRQSIDLSGAFKSADVKYETLIYRDGSKGESKDKVTVQVEVRRGGKT